ncbi:MAG: hypothetical protein KDC34_04975 [Saprospiraceae bacterium]|nr:hypothetical protein [Saprospiraceae bacterium]
MANYDKDTNERIGDFLDGNLDSAGQKSFQEDLRKNKAIQSTLDLHKAVEETLSDKGEAALEATLRSMRKPTTQVKVRRIQPKWLAAAAAVAVLVVAFFLFRPTDTPTALTGPIAAYFEPGQMEITQMGGNAEALLTEGQQAYNQADFPLALQKLQAYLAVDPEHENARLFAAKSAIASASFDQALNLLFYFDSISSLHTEEVTWLKALAYIGSNQPEKAKPLLSALQNGTDAKLKAQAEELYQELY